jgi:hypothetical protein
VLVRHFIAKYQHKQTPNRPVPHSSQYEGFTAISWHFQEKYFRQNMLNAYLFGLPNSLAYA